MPSEVLRQVRSTSPGCCPRPRSGRGTWSRSSIRLASRQRHPAIGVALLPRGPVEHGAPFAGTAGLLSGRVEARVVQPPVGIRPLKSLVSAPRCAAPPKPNDGPRWPSLVSNPEKLTPPAPSGRRTIVGLEWNPLDALGRTLSASNDRRLQPLGKPHESNIKGNRRPPQCASACRRRGVEDT